MCLLIMKKSIDIVIRGAILDSDNAKTYLETMEEYYKGTSKVHAGNLILILLTSMYDGKGSIRKHLMMMNDIANKLKALEMPIGETFLFHFIMTSLPASFEYFKVSYNAQKDKWKISELNEMCVQEEERQKLDKPKVAYLMTANANKRKGKFPQREYPKVQKKDASVSFSSNNSKVKLHCKFCRKNGHTQKDCKAFKE
ncbi:hypothetical protein SSX86_023872 [Deinandra increscens subsp. villosa]|uniref:CCHC-type domain-containing protein n=1 Tax=Deinandra increscens subsp. villosa TaxID=3103831 RepID=A0AAP0CM33_9ASTR